MTCDYCGADIDPNNPGQSTAEDVLCAGCTRQAQKWTEDAAPVTPDHVVTGHPVNEPEPADEPPEEDATPLDDNRDFGDPGAEYDGAECQLCGEPMGQEPGDCHADCMDREQCRADHEYDDARNLNAAALMAEIRRMA